MFSKIIDWLQECFTYRSGLEQYLSKSQNRFELEVRERDYFLKASKRYFNID